jgi:phosphocarrier protein
MIERDIRVSNAHGLHMRPAGLIVELLKNTSAQVYIEADGDRVNAKSLINLLTLSALYDTRLKIIADGTDEEQVLSDVVKLFESKFGEE